MSQERQVGLMVIVGMLCLGALVVFLGKIHINAPGYPILVDFNYVDSLKPDAPVLYGGGVKIGSVDDISVNNDKVRVALHLLEPYKIPKNSVVTIHTSGILGEKYIQIDAGNSALGVLDPNSVVDGVDPGSLDRTLQRIEVLTDFLQPFLADPKFKASFTDTMENLNGITKNLGDLIENSSGDITESVKNLKDLSEGLRSRVDEMKSIIDNAHGMVSDENRKNLQESLEHLDSTLTRLDRAMAQIDAKKGPLGMAVYDDKAAQDLRDILSDLKSHPWKLLWKK